MVRHGTVHFCRVFHWIHYLVPGTFLVPPRPRFQAIRTVTKTWRVNSTDHWLAWKKIVITASLNLRHETQHIPARFKSAQPAKDRMQLLFEQTHLFVSINIAVSLSVEEVQMFLSLIAKERIQLELDGATWNEKALRIYFLHFVYF